MRPFEGPAPLGSPESARRRWTPQQRSLAALTAIFVASRAVFYAAGIRFDDSGLGTFYQFLDTDFLRHDLARSIYHLHAQPPLFNLYLGLVVHLPQSWWHTAFVLTFAGLGLALIWSMFCLMCEFHVPRPAAFAVTVLFAIAPATIVYENFLFYTYLDATLLVAAGLFLVRFLRSRRTMYGVLTFSLLAALVLTRSAFHVLWLALIVGLVWAMGSLGWKKVLAAAAIPFIVATAWYGKNLAEFGTFSSSTWLGMNLTRVVFADRDDPYQLRLVANGTLGSEALIPAFSPVAKYRGIDTRSTGVPALDRRRMASGVINFNNQAYIEISDRYLADSLTYIRRRPGSYLRNLAKDVRIAFVPAAQYFGVNRNAQQISEWQSLYSRWIEGQLHGYQRGVYLFGAPEAGNVAWTLVLAYGSTIVSGPVLLWLLLRRRVEDRPVALTMLVLSTTVLYALVVTSALEQGENHRFRFDTDPIVWVMTAALITFAVRKWRGRSAGSATLTPTADALVDANPQRD